MKLVKQRRKAEPDIPVVSMSDIAFLLIIFFLVTTNFVKESHIKLKLPKAETGEDEDKIQINVSMDQDGELWLNGKPTASLKVDLGKLLGDKKGDKRKVFFKCHKGILNDVYMAAIEEINEAGGLLILKTDEKKVANGAKMKKSDEPEPTPPKVPEPAPSPTPDGPGVEMEGVLE
ncbi:MAG: biopolymer transporter ExbD [Planctomycetota bacterium]|jgi:biopolymer transport protein ExbD|nr:biopolymer transporter ExbD [Planctomycetota bacterium]